MQSRLIADEGKQTAKSTGDASSANKIREYYYNDERA